MSFTYNNNLTTSLDRVRFNIGDVVDGCSNFSDEEITAILSDNNDNIIQTSLQLLDNLITKYSLRANETVGRVSINYSLVVDNLVKAKENLALNNMVSGGIYAGGISVTQKDSYFENSDIVQPAFTRDEVDLDACNDEER